MSHKIKSIYYSYKIFSALFLSLIFIIIIFSDKGHIAGDGILRWKALTTLMEEQTLTTDKYSMVQPIIAIPLYKLGDFFFIVKTTFNSKNKIYNNQQRIQTIKKIVSKFNKFIIFIIAIWFYFLLINIFQFNPIQSSIATLLLIFGSMLIPHAKDFYSECLWTLLNLFSISYLSCLEENHNKNILDIQTIFKFILPTALSIALNPLLACVFTLFFITLFLVNKPFMKKLSSALNPLLLGGVTVMLGILISFIENYLRRGDILNYGYPGEGFTTPFWVGFAGQIFAPSRGVLFFIPTFFIGFCLLYYLPKNEYKKRHNLVKNSLIYSLFLIIAYSKWHAWHGAWYWGPRFLLPLSVFGILYYVVFFKFYWGCIQKTIQGILLITGGMSIIVYKIGVAINQSHLMNCLKNATNQEMCYWDFTNIPYISLFQKEDIIRILIHRSTLVEVIGMLLFLTLIRYVVPQNKMVKDK